MQKFLVLSAAVSLLGVVGGNPLAAAPRPVKQTNDVSIIKAAENPPRASATGRANRSATANTKGANKKGFCPPGQRKKPGKGSAFEC